MTTDKYQAGIWEQGKGFVAWSEHARRDLAEKAARGYARKAGAQNGGKLSWAGGVRDPSGSITWIDRSGAVIQ